MITDMAKIRVIGTKRHMPKVIGVLHSMKLVHLVEKQPEEGLDIGRPEVNAETIADALVQLKSIGSQLNVSNELSLENKKKIDDKFSSNNVTIDAILKETFGLSKSAKDALGKKRENASKIELMQDPLSKLEILESLGLDLADLKDYNSISYFIGYVKSKDELQKSISPKIVNYHLKYTSQKKKDLIALFIPKKEEDMARKFLAASEFLPIDLAILKESANLKIYSSSNISSSGKKSSLPVVPTSKTLKNDLMQSISDAENEIKQASEILSVHKKNLEKNYNAHLRVLSVALEKAEAPLRFQVTRDSFVISGFVPKEDVGLVMAKLNDVTKNHIYIDTEEPKSGDKIPTSLKNISPVQDFKFFLDLYSLPKYKEIDPSWFLFLTFPMLFGFMLGDIGYGITTLILFWLMKKKMKKIGQFLNILMHASFWTIVFGAVFGEFYGFEIYHPLISRNPEHNLMVLIGVAIAIGVIHINIGLVSGFINELRSHGLKHAFMEKISWIILELSILFLVLGYMNNQNNLIMAGYIILAVSVFMIYKVDGIKGLVEIPGIFGNVLSYMRLMAIGLSSVGLALVINSMATDYFHSGGVGFFIGILILLIGHVVNLGIGLLGGFLHSLRLHYVEFFSKFYKGGGIRFKPFGAERQ